MHVAAHYHIIMSAQRLCVYILQLQTTAVRVSTNAAPQLFVLLLHVQTASRCNFIIFSTADRST